MLMLLRKVVRYIRSSLIHYTEFTLSTSTLNHCGENIENQVAVAEVKIIYYISS